MARCRGERRGEGKFLEKWKGDESDGRGVPAIVKGRPR